MNARVPKISDLLDTAKRWGIRGLGRLRKTDLGKMLARLLPERPVRELVQLGRNLGLEGLSGLKKNELVMRLSAMLRGERHAAGAPAEKAAPARKDERAASRQGGSRSRPIRTASGRLELVARDPNWLYAWWEFNAEVRRRLGRPGTVPVLRVVAVEADQSERQVARIDLPLHARSWHLRVEHAATRYRAYLELRHSRGATEVVLISETVCTPGEAPARETAILVMDQAGERRVVEAPAPKAQRRLQQLSTPPRPAAGQVPSSAGPVSPELPSSGPDMPSSR